MLTKVSPSVSPITVSSEQSAAAFTNQRAPELQAKLQGHDGAVRRIVINVPHTVNDNGMPHQLPLTSKLMFTLPHALLMWLISYEKVSNCSLCG